uniref:Uncharacterized protein n=1 Tax=Rhizophagus irregularis (strain DAOM 181602 / DAOM 197198 / MUCL 43194) TaxID=747089 RepID=U9V178_RHIID
MFFEDCGRRYCGILDRRGFDCKRGYCIMTGFLIVENFESWGIMICQDDIVL